MNDQVSMVFWDVQHGHSAYVRSPNGRHIVIDLGTGSYGSKPEFSPLLHLRDNYGIQRLDYVIITHPHVDHIDDILNFDSLNPKVLQRPKHLDKKPILDAATEKERPKLVKYFEITERYNQTIPDDSPDNPRNPANYGGLKIHTFTPRGCSQNNINNHSVVVFFEYAGIKALLPGDNEPPSWNELKKMAGFLDITKDLNVLLAPHHGRNSGFDNDTMTHFNPRITVVSDGQYCDSSATARYTEKSRGLMVCKKDGTKQRRHCLTTRKDGPVFVSFGKNNGGGPLQITIN